MRTTSLESFDRAAFSRTGAARFCGALDGGDLATLGALAAALAPGDAGVRLSASPALDQLLGQDAPLTMIAWLMLGLSARPVRALLFDKTDASNWSVAWHQDRTIAVRRRVDVEGYGPWSTKADVQHVEPPFSLIERMITLRAHLDPVDEVNAPLLVAQGSHRLGRIPADRTAQWAADLEILTCLADAGDVWAYSTPILHASQKAARPTRRRVLQVDFSVDDLPGGLEWLGAGGRD